MDLSRIRNGKAAVVLSLFLFAVPPLVVAQVSAAAQPTPTGNGPCSITLLYNASVHGEIDDCGCKSKPLGGVARRAALVDQLCASSSNRLLIDGGNLFGKPGSEGRAQTEFLCAQTAAMGYEVFGVGASEFVYGLEFLRAMERQHGFAYTSANLVDAETGDLLFPPYQIVKEQGIKVGFLSVMDPALELKDESGPIEGVTIGSPLKAVEQVLPELREQVDLVILVSNLKSNGTRQLLTDLGSDAGVDVAIEGHVGRRYPRAQKVGETVLLAANGRGKYLGQCELMVQDGNVVDTTVNVHELKLDLPEQEQMAGRVDEFKKQQEALAQASR